MKAKQEKSLLEVLLIFCHRIVEPHGLGVNFFSRMRQSLSALLNICNETSRGPFFSFPSICLSLFCLFTTLGWSMAEISGTPAVVMAPLD